MSGLSLEFKNFESTMSGSPDVLGGAPTDSELMQMLRQQQDFNNALLLRVQAMEDARVTIASPPPAPQRATRHLPPPRPACVAVWHSCSLPWG